ncbi:hydrogenase nickel incorporation protein HypB [Candidatus Sumerlaeota bacterium]|nr:hydrogenase nickel incorporation protein HypB [Candidatus Sumerlaeota bacterium]
MEIRVVENLLKANEAVAAQTLERLAKHGVRAINMIGSAGSGKTALLEATLPRLRESLGVAVIEGDLQTTRDAERIDRIGVPVVQVTTGKSCHLPPQLVLRALDGLDLDAIDLLFIENVGNLICPSEIPVGEHHKVAVLSTPEGDDKVLKYPMLFHLADAVVINKIDLLPHVTCDVGRIRSDLEQVGSRAQIFEVSARTGEGLDGYIGWLLGLVG